MSSTSVNAAAHRAQRHIECVRSKRMSACGSRPQLRRDAPSRGGRSDEGRNPHSARTMRPTWGASKSNMKSCAECRSRHRFAVVFREFVLRTLPASHQEFGSLLKASVEMPLSAASNQSALNVARRPHIASANGLDGISRTVAARRVLRRDTRKLFAHRGQARISIARCKQVHGMSTWHGARNGLRAEVTNEDE